MAKYYMVVAKRLNLISVPEEGCNFFKYHIDLRSDTIIYTKFSSF